MADATGSGGYKHAIAREWNRAAEGWHAWVPFVRNWLREPTDRMIDRAAITLGSRVLDVAAGDGDQSIDAARRAGPGGSVVAIDTAAEMLRLAVESAHAAGLTIETQVMDAESLSFPDASFDAAISRLGMMYCQSPGDAFRELRRVVVPGGRVAVIVFATAEQNPFFSIPVSVIRRRLATAPPAAGSPGPFALGAPGALRRALEAGGLVEVNVEAIEAPVRMASTAECVRFRREASGTLGAMMAPMDESTREATWAEMHHELSAFETASEFVSPCTVLLGSATVP